MAHARLRILLGEATAIGPGKADLLDAIDEAGSISGAARRMGMSYRRAWILANAMNHSFVEPLICTETGGARGGGARLTDLGREVLRRYRRMEARAQSAVAPELEELRTLLAERDDGHD